MNKETKIITINHNKLPGKFTFHRLLDEIFSRKKPSLESVMKQYINVDKPTIIYGAGNLGKMAKEYFDKLNVPILFVVDREPEIHRKEEFWNNVEIEIIKPEEVPPYLRKNAVFIISIVTNSYNSISSFLRKKEFINLVPFYDITLAYQDKHPLNNGWCTDLLDNKDKEGMEYVLSHLQDDISCAHYLQFIAYHSLREEWIFSNAPIKTKEKYFILEIVSILNENETFVNVGAYDGEFTNKFIKTVNNKFNSVYAFEPDHKNIDKFLTNVDMNRYNIHLIPKALGRITEKKKFYSDLKCLSQISELGQEEIEVYKLDDFKLSPTIIKIHTEGTECDIFDGGIETIKKNRPVIMMTVYHNRRNLWETLSHVMNSLTNYIYYFRLHLWCGTCAIVYAIPKERLK